MLFEIYPDFFITYATLSFANLSKLIFKMCSLFLIENLQHALANSGCATRFFQFNADCITLQPLSKFCKIVSLLYSLNHQFESHFEFQIHYIFVLWFSQENNQSYLPLSCKAKIPSQARNFKKLLLQHNSLHIIENKSIFKHVLILICIENQH